MRRLIPAAVLAVAVLTVNWVSAPAAPTALPAALTAFESAEIDAMAPLAADIGQQAERLRDRLASVPKPPAPRRDPFSFGGRRPAPEAVTATLPQDTETVIVPAAELVWPALVAVMSEDAATGRHWTAALSWGDAMDVLTAGGRFHDFEVVSVAAASVELRHVPSNEVRKISLR